MIKKDKYICLFGPEQIALYVTYKCQLALYELSGDGIRKLDFKKYWQNSAYIK